MEEIMRLQDKVAVITGAGSGMGRAMAFLFAHEGAKVVACDWNPTTLNEVVAGVQAEGGTIVGVQGDISVQSDAERCVDTAISTYKRIDILVNNAGVMDLNQGVGEVTNDMWQRVIGINLNGPMYASRRAIPHMVQQGGGSIINVASIAGMGGGAAGSAYTTSKFALIGLTKSTAWMYTLKNIRCNAIAAGAVETNIVASVDPTKFDPEGSARTQPYIQTMTRTLQPIDIAHLALFLASDESKNINGAIIPADAGWRAA
jgi:NAD(P)-dependent dehydrogenase (short-subunit alcohol dehydrogenase family)